MDEQMIADALEAELKRQGLRLMKDAAAQPDVRLVGVTDWGGAISLNDLARAAHSVIAGKVAELEEVNARLRRCLLPVVMTFAQAECVDEPIPDDAVVLHFMGSGASDQVTAGEVRAALAPYPERRHD